MQILKKESFLYSIFFILFIIVFSQLKATKNWLNEKIFPYYKSMPAQYSAQKIEQRLHAKVAFDYQNIQKMNAQLGSINVLMLPPLHICKENQVSMIYAEPHGIYYYTQKFKTTKAKYADYKTVTHVLIIENSQIKILKILSKDLFNFWKNEYLKIPLTH